MEETKTKKCGICSETGSRMTRAVRELRSFLETVPDGELIDFREDGLTFYHSVDGEFGIPFDSFVVSARFEENIVDDFVESK